MRYIITILLLQALLVVACKPRPATQPSSIISPLADAIAPDTTGKVQMISITTPIGKYQVWTKRMGNNPTKKILLLHGGPGGTHETFESFAKHLPQAGVEYIYYNQLGSLYSDDAKDSSLYTIQHYVSEVEQVRQALGLDSSNFYLLGHSWGGILAMEYTLKYQQHIKGLIISNMMSDCPAYDAYNKQVLQPQMPKAVVDSILAFEIIGNTANPRYMQLLMQHYYNLHVCRIQPMPDALSRMFAHLNPVIYNVMQGPSEFGISGRLANWSCTSRLKNITKPTLVIRGMYDTMDPAYMEMMSKQLPNGTLVTCTKGSHCSMWDDEENYFKGLLSFVK